MRLVLDTNTVVSALFWSGAPRVLLDLVYAGQVEAFTSDELVLELEDVLGRAKFVHFLEQLGAGAHQVSLNFAAIATLVQPVKLQTPVCEDPDDDAVLECALAAAADAIVTGDRHLLALGSFQGIEIAQAPEVLRRVVGAP